MFAPPDPSTPATPPPGPPPPPSPSVPTLPTAGTATTLTDPGSCTPPPPPPPPVPATPAPVFPVEAPQEAGVTPYLAAVPARVQPEAPPVPATEEPVPSSDVSDERPAPPRRLLRTSWLRRVVIWGNVLAIPGAFVGDLVGTGLLALSVLALLVWSGVIAANVRRSRPATRHGSAPHPLAATFSWLLAPIVAIFAGIGVSAVAAWADSGTFDEQGSRTMALAGVVFVAGVIVLIAMYQPYRILARCAKWANSDGGLFRKWFAAPIVAVFVAIVVQVLASLVALTDSADGSSGTASIGAGLVLLSAVALPWLAWLIVGGRAMRSLESGVANVHSRALRESQDPAAVNPFLAGQVASAAAGAGEVSVPTA